MLTSPLIQMWIKTHRYFVCMKDPYLINASSPRTYKSRYKKGDKAKIRTQQLIKLNTRANEIQQVNPGRPHKQPTHQAPTISSIDKSLSRIRHDWVDHQACSLLQCIKVIVNLFIMGNYFNELRWKSIGVNNLLQFIHQVTIEFRFRKSLA